MGFSISGSAAIIFAGMLLSFGIFYGATSNSFDRISEARTAQADAVVAEHNVDINVVAYERIGSTNRLTILVNNTGSTALSVDKTDLFVDNAYITSRKTQVDGNSNTDLWAPGQQLNITVRVSTPARAKIVSEHGIADTVVVSGNSKVVF
ncbi:MAG: flagellin [Halorientalis sp.]